MQRKPYILLMLVSLLSFPHLGQAATINYVDQGSSETTSTEIEESASGQTIEEVNASEGILGEQIIISISKDGYVTSHGDHYHTYNGTVPFDGIFSEAILTPADYQLDEAAILSEIAEGYIVQTEQKILVYLTDSNKRTSIRTRDEINLQSYGVNPSDAREIVNLKRSLELPEGNKISYQLDKDLAEVVKEVQAQEAVVVYLMKDGYVALIGTDLFVFPHQVPSDVVFASLLLVPSDYELNSEEIIADTAEGHIVKTEAGYRLYLANPTQAQSLKELGQE